MLCIFLQAFCGYGFLALFSIFHYFSNETSCVGRGFIGVVGNKIKVVKKEAGDRLSLPFFFFFD